MNKTKSEKPRLRIVPGEKQDESTAQSEPIFTEDLKPDLEDYYIKEYHSASDMEKAEGDEETVDEAVKTRDKKRASS